MYISVPMDVKEVEFWKFRPTGTSRTRPKKVSDPEFIQGVRSILKQNLKAIEYCPDPIFDERYVAVLHSPRRKKPFAFHLIGNCIVVNERCYVAQTKELWKLLEKYVSRQRESALGVGKPALVRSRHK